MVQGLLDFFTGGGQYADPNNIDPRTGVPMGDVRQAGWNAIGNMSALLLAAGQPMAPQQRAAYLAQLGQAAGGVNTDLYNASQRRLMTARAQQERQEMEENKRIDEMLKDPAQLSSLGIDPQQARVLGRGGVRQLLANRMSQSPEAQERSRLELEQARSGAQLRSQLMQSIDADTTLNDQQKVLFKANPDLYAKRFAPASWSYMNEAEKAKAGIPANVPAIMTAEGPKVLNTGPSTVVNLGNKAGQVAVDELTKANIADVEAARQSVENINQSNQIRALLDEGVITGFGAEGRALLGSAAQTLGLRADDPTIANTYVATTQLASRVLAAAQNMKGGLSDKDVAFLKQASGGTIALPEASIRRILDLADRVDRRQIESGRRAAEDLSSLPALQESGFARSNRLKINEPQPYEKQINVDGQQLKARLGVDGRYFVIRDGKKFFVEE